MNLFACDLTLDLDHQQLSKLKLLMLLMKLPSKLLLLLMASLFLSVKPKLKKMLENLKSNFFRTLNYSDRLSNL